MINPQRAILEQYRRHPGYRKALGEPEDPAVIVERDFREAAALQASR
jgi:hypothetical protein